VLGGILCHPVTFGGGGCGYRDMVLQVGDMNARHTTLLSEKKKIVLQNPKE
jgi:hypothetical protein